ncbi:MAG: hypothetical protein HY216_08410 [Candidatus Rokubacteria bacterium]|nr:hypothetical protein [Candidatus Rokubacteria bacterium]
MRIVRGLESYPPDAPPAAVALGVFDGIHLAHRAILATALGRARALGVEAVACTFDPHPMEILQPDRAPLPLTTMDERLDLIARTGIGTTVVLDFTPELAAMEPEAFVKEVILGRLNAREVIVGFNHTFGRGARGDAKLLRDLAGQLGFHAHIVPPLLVDGTPASSSAIRAALQAGDALTVEAHLLDFTGDLYERRVRLEWVGHLREERRFDGVEALRAQIARDVADARRRL